LFDVRLQGGVVIDFVEMAEVQKFGVRRVACGHFSIQSRMDLRAKLAAEGRIWIRVVDDQYGLCTGPLSRLDCFECAEQGSGKGANGRNSEAAGRKFHPTAK
jgi:hypothetical protein